LEIEANLKLRNAFVHKMDTEV